MIKHLQKIILAAAMLFFAHSSWAYDFYVVSNGDTIYYTITSNTSPYTVAVTRNINSQYSGSVTIPSSVTYNGLTFSVTRIEDSAFYNCRGLTSVTIPNSVKNIEQRAFYRCSSLTQTNYTGTIAQWCDIDFEGYSHSPIRYSQNLYINNQLVTNLVIPNTVDTIKQFAFYGDTCIISVTIPNSVTSIGQYAFSGCTGITSVTIPNSVTSIEECTFDGCTGLISVIIPDSVTSIGNYAFYSCTGLTSVTIPNSVTSIGIYAFGNVKHISYGGSATGSPWGALSINGLLDGDFVYSDSAKTYIVKYIGNGGNVIVPDSVTSIGDSAFYGCTGLTSVTIPNSVRNIGRYAFFYSGLTRTNYTGTIAQWCDIDFMDNPISYSRNLYINNQLITNLVIPNTVDTINNNAFCGDTCITSLTIPNSVTTIGGGAFTSCTGLTSVTIPNSVRNIGSYAFYGCTGLTRTNYTGTIAQWCDIDFVDIYANPIRYSQNLYINNQLITNLVIPNTVDTLKQCTFSGDTCITSLTIPNSVTTIGDGAFYSCTGLTSVTIPNSVRNIGGSAFYGCTGLTSVTISNSVTSIEEYTFYGCTGLISVIIPDSVRNIGGSAFHGCTGLTSVTIPNSVRNIGRYAFFYSGLTRTNYTGTIAQWCDIDFMDNPISYSRNLYINNQLITNLVIPNTVDTINNNAFCGDTCITSLTIPNSVTSIGNYAFASCTNLTSVTIPNSVTSIGERSFGSCTGLTSVTIGNSVTIIGNYAFYGCAGLTSVTIGNSVTSIGNYTFYYCTGLTSVTFRRANTTIGTDAFSGLPVSLPFHIPCGSSAWYMYELPSFTNFIEELSFTYSVSSQDTTMGTVATITAPLSCNTPLWTVRATANTGYTFSRWSDGDTNTQRTLTVTQDTTLVAYFTANTPQWYRFSVVSEDTLKGTVQIITQPSQANPQATFEALPNTGYTFSRWSDGNTQNPRSLTVTQDTTLVAYFTANTPQWYRFSVVSEDTLKGTVQIITQPSQANPQATFEALPNTGYTFSRWSDGNTQNPRSITVTQDTILIAFFTSTQGIAKAENVSITIYPNPASDKVTLEGIGNEADIFIINALGKVVRRLENAGGTITFSVADLPKGIYFVRVGNAVRKLVVE